ADVVDAEVFQVSGQTLEIAVHEKLPLNNWKPRESRGLRSGSFLASLAHQEGNEVDELLLGEALLQPLRHGADGRLAQLVQVFFLDDVLLPLVVGQGEHRAVLGDLHAADELAVLQDGGPGAEAGRNGPAWLQDRFDNVDTREAGADAGQLGADAFAG